MLPSSVSLGNIWLLVTDMLKLKCIILPVKILYHIIISQLNKQTQSQLFIYLKFWWLYWLRFMYVCLYIAYVCIYLCLVILFAPIFIYQIQVPPVHSKPAKYSIEMYFYVRSFKAWSMYTKCLFVMGQTKTRTCDPWGDSSRDSTLLEMTFSLHFPLARSCSG